MAGNSHEHLTLGEKNSHLLQLCFLFFHLHLEVTPQTARKKGSISGNSTMRAKKLYLNLKGELALPTFIVWPSEDAEY